MSRRILVYVLFVCFSTLIVSFVWLELFSEDAPGYALLKQVFAFGLGGTIGCVLILAIENVILRLKE